MTEVPSTPAEVSTSKRRSPTRVVAAIVGLLAIVAAAALVTWIITGDDEGGDYVVEVAAGTGARIESGEEIELIPARVELDVGDTLVIVNDDDQIHQVGPYVVGPSQTLRQTFASPGTVEGLCSLHPSGQVEIIVR